ncbi:MAG: aromatic ring-hydroxylating dioxygenase subunit alpha [Betaproteobacteria bacterium]|jgi:phenylpropionate dioxygenase-like ring-hydroxylating dioxygenase large terminal subunit|nr:MAG: aromatic ring-hydroxylating dioxygenase subunit alpha [Betaproteobacteria bacterium]
MNAPDSKVSRRSNLDPALISRTAPLPVAWYLDRAWYEREMLLLFDRGPNYAGHELMVPQPGDYISLPWMDDRKVLVRDPRGVNLLSNVCRHRQARLLDGRGRVRNIVCPVHRWTYDLDGRLLGAPDFDQTPQCSLPSTRLSNWRGLLFAGPRDPNVDLADFPLQDDYNWSGYVFDRSIVEECPFNWKEFLEIFLELYHVEAAHPGLQNWVDAANYEWGFGDRWSYQILGVNDQLRVQTSANYEKYRDAILRYSDGRLPRYGTVWSIVYPNVMIEWYPFALVISTLIPRGPDHTTNVVEFYYPEEIQAFERQIVEAHQASYAESGAEDARICARLHDGRRALWLAGEDDVGPYHTPHEDGMIHLHDWIRREMGQRRTP